MDWNAHLLIQKPIYQAILCLLLTPILIFLIQPKNADRAWLIAAFIFIAFIIINAVMLWFDDHPWNYFLYSIGFALSYLLFIAIMMPGLIRVLHLKSPEESAMTFLVLIYQPFILLLVMLAKWVVAKWF